MSNVSHGACACRAVSFDAQVPPENVIHCHCGLCRRLSGAAFTTWATFGREMLRITGRTQLTAFAATRNVTRHFCKVCGTHVYSSDARYADVVGVPAGILVGALPIEPQGHYFVSDKAPWHPILDTLPCFGGISGFEAIQRSSA